MAAFLATDAGLKAVRIESSGAAATAVGTGVLERHDGSTWVGAGFNAKPAHGTLCGNTQAATMAYDLNRLKKAMEAVNAVDTSSDMSGQEIPAPAPLKGSPKAYDLTRLKQAMDAVRNAEEADRENRKRDLPRANLLMDMGLDTRERIHVRMLHWLLDSNEDATHEQRGLFLRAYLKEAGCPESICSLAADRCPDVVASEWSHTSADNRIRADLLHAWISDAVVLTEAKILAVERPEQLSDYERALAVDFADVSPERRFIIFLTPDGREPRTIDSKRASQHARVTWVSLEKVAQAMIDAYAQLDVRNTYLERVLDDYLSLASHLAKRRLR